MGNSSTIIYKCGSRYEGQTNNNLPHGKGKLFIHVKSPAYDQKILISKQNSQFAILQGQFKQGKLIKCRFTIKSGFTYEGLVNQNNQFEGDGKMVDKQNIIYEGCFDTQGKLVKGLINSNACLNSQLIKYVCSTEGEFIGTSILNGHGKYHNITDNYLAQGDFHKGNLSKGTYILYNGDLYQGEYSHGILSGAGVYRTKTNAIQQIKAHPDNFAQLPETTQIYSLISNRQDSDRTQFCYQGQFVGKLPQGKGEVTFMNGDKFTGKFKGGRMHSYGEYSFADGTVYKGNFYFGQMTGQCTIQYTERSQINMNKKEYEILQKYEGEMSENAFHGLGVLYYANGVIFKGYFLNGAKNGPGVLIYCDKKYKCLYMMNRLIGQLKIIQD